VKAAKSIGPCPSYCRADCPGTQRPAHPPGSCPGLDELKETAAPAIAGLAEDERADVDEIVAMLTGNLEKIAEHGRRTDGIVKSMLEHSRGVSGERREVDLNALVDEGTGLGLSISWDIVTQQHGGSITVDSRAGEFTEFTMRLPRRL
jgi:hypothetical protein